MQQLVSLQVLDDDSAKIDGSTRYVPWHLLAVPYDTTAAGITAETSF
jgi:hypothetical protein